MAYSRSSLETLVRYLQTFNGQKHYAPLVLNPKENALMSFLEPVLSQTDRLDIITVF